MIVSYAGTRVNAKKTPLAPESCLGYQPPLTRLAHAAIVNLLYDCLKAAQPGTVVAIDPRSNPFIFMAKQCSAVILRNTGLSQPVANRVAEAVEVHGLGTGKVDAEVKPASRPMS